MTTYSEEFEKEPDENSRSWAVAGKWDIVTNRLHTPVVDTASLRAIEEGMTPGPWRVDDDGWSDDDGVNTLLIYGGGAARSLKEHCCAQVQNYGQGEAECEATAEGIVAIRNAVVALLDENDRLRAKNERLKRYEWRAIGVNQDGDLHLGHQFWGGSFYGLAQADWFLLRRYLRAWRRLDWWGLRSWLWSHALHAAVYQRRPGACNQPPPAGQGGYSHWLCTLRRGHDGMHRYNAYTWGEIGGEMVGAIYHPGESS